MRLTRFHLFLLGGLFLMVMGPLAFTQPGPDGGKGGRKGGKGFNSDTIFSMISGGKDTFDVKTVQLQSWGRGPTPEQQKEQMMAFLQKKGVTNGTMTKSLYAEHFQERMTEMQAKRGDKDKQGVTPPAPGATPSTPATPAVPPVDVEAKARESFASMDTDKNNSLSVEEIKASGQSGQSLLADLAKWDTNQNGTIELTEYVAYYKTIGGSSGPAPVKPIEEEPRPIVYRAGKLPKEIPAWFIEADTDKDGQVGLYEWKASGKSVSEFMAMDQNGDGFITAEEVLRYQRATTKSTDTSSFGSPGRSPSPDASQADDSRGKGKGGFGRGKSGRQKGG